MAAETAYTSTAQEATESSLSTEDDDLGAVDAVERPDELESLPELVCRDSRDDDIGDGACSVFEDTDDDNFEMWDVIDDPVWSVEELDKASVQPPLGIFPLVRRKLSLVFGRGPA